MGRSFHQPGTVKENVLESDFEPLCDGTTRRLSLADLRLLEGMKHHSLRQKCHTEHIVQQLLSEKREFFSFLFSLFAIIRLY